MENFSGILFTLKKREQNISEDDSKYYKYMILGSFDGLDIHTVDRWYELRPKGLQERKLQVDLNVPFIDQYTIRALVPSNTEKLDNMGFAYEFWKKVGEVEPEKFKEHQKAIRKKYPFVCMAVLNFTEKFIKAQDDLQMMQESVIKIILDSVKNAKYDLKELHCAVFPSLGYSDFVILFLTEDLLKAANIINQVRSAVINNNIPLVSNCYSVCGLDKECLASGNAKLGDNTQITIRINFREGISAGNFLELLNEELKNDLKVGSDIEEIDAFVEEVNKNYYITFGNADCLFLPRQSLDQYLKWHGSGQILSPEHSFFQKYIADVRTSVRINEDECFINGNEHIDNLQDLTKYEKLFKEFIRKYDKFLKKNDMHIRNSRALQQVMKNFLNVAYVSHGFDARSIIGKSFECLIENMDYYISLKKKKISGNLSDSCKLANLEYNKEIQISQYKAVEAAEEFKIYIGNFLSNLIRSDRPFIEGNVLTHSSIGSATKLLFAYSALLEKLTRSFGEENFSFIVSSGGCDKTEAIDIFSFVYEPVKLKKLIIIMVPEMSLYDIQGTLFRILHEYMHFIGNRMRKVRYRHLVNALAEYMAWEICEYEFNSDRFSNIYEKVIIHLTDSLKNHLKCLIESKYMELKEGARKQISAIISNHSDFVMYEELKGENNFYSSKLLDGIFAPESLVHIFSINEEEFKNIKSECLQKKIYEVFYEKDKEFVISIMSIIDHLCGIVSKNEKQRLIMSKQSLCFLEQNYKFRDAYPYANDMSIIHFIEQYISSFIRNYQLNYDNKNAFPAYYSYTELMDNFMFSMIESFSDCTAICMLKMNVEDFLLAFIYELWEIDQAFPMTIGNILRLGADLKVSYGIEKKLDDRIKECIYKKVEKRTRQGYKYQNVDKMISYIDELLKKYQLPEIKGVCAELEQYLTKCKEENKEWCSKDLSELYEFCNEGEYGIDYKVVNRLICLWKNLGDEGKYEDI
ncbi:hypothetical protein AALA78_02840 [Lachnospiraceae bacterium 42-17]